MERQIIPDEGKATGGEKMKPILIVEDEVVVRESLRDWLTDSGYQVETAKEGEEALKAIAQQDFSIALLDLKLPGKDGIEVLREAREKSPALKGIIITAYPSLESAVEAVKVGAVDYLPKPLDLNQLEKLIRKLSGNLRLFSRLLRVILRHGFGSERQGKRWWRQRLRGWMKRQDPSIVSG